jgi:hypothetical protein
MRRHHLGGSGSMEVPGRAPDGARARIGARAWAVPAGRLSLLRTGGALWQGSPSSVVRLAAMTLDTPQASVKVPGKRCSLKRTCIASTHAETPRKSLPSVILAARNQTLLNWATDDQRFPDCDLCDHAGAEGFRAGDGRPARVRGRLAGRSVTAARVAGGASDEAVPTGGFQSFRGGGPGDVCR